MEEFRIDDGAVSYTGIDQSKYNLEILKILRKAIKENKQLTFVQIMIQLGIVEEDTWNALPNEAPPLHNERCVYSHILLQRVKSKQKPSKSRGK